MQLSDFETLVEDALPAGAAYTANIPNFVRMAARWIERNYNFSYMNVIDGDAFTAPSRTIVFPVAFVKRFNFWRLVLDDGEYQYLHKADPEDLKVLETATPTHYYLDGVTNLILAQTPDQDYNYEMSWVNYTDWSSLISTSEPWLLLNADDVMLGQTLMMISSFTRDEKAKVFWKDFRDDALKTLLDADHELQSSTTSQVMNYGNATQVGNR